MPRLDDGTDVGGLCADVTDATPCKEKALDKGFMNSPCASCGTGYTFYHHNSNYWVSQTLRHFDMTPPWFYGGSLAPGYEWGKGK